jgi:hypothetical protein
MEDHITKRIGNLEIREGIQMEAHLRIEGHKYPQDHSENALFFSPSNGSLLVRGSFPTDSLT